MRRPPAAGRRLPTAPRGAGSPACAPRTGGVGPLAAAAWCFAVALAGVTGTVTAAPAGGACPAGAASCGPSLLQRTSSFTRRAVPRSPAAEEAEAALRAAEAALLEEAAGSAGGESVRLYKPYLVKMRATCGPQGDLLGEDLANYRLCGHAAEEAGYRAFSLGRGAKSGQCYGERMQVRDHLIAMWWADRVGAECEEGEWKPDDNLFFFLLITGEEELDPMDEEHREAAKEEALEDKEVELEEEDAAEHHEETEDFSFHLASPQGPIVPQISDVYTTKAPETEAPVFSVATPHGDKEKATGRWKIGGSKWVATPNGKDIAWVPE